MGKLAAAVFVVWVFVWACVVSAVLVVAIHFVAKYW